MMASLKSELRKLLTVRSTYILLVSALALIALFSYVGTSVSTYEEATCAKTGEVYYSQDYTDERLQNASPEDLCGGQVNYNQKTASNLSADKLLFNLQETVPVITMFITFAVVLLMGHEFRYNTISHTLTISNSRSKTLLAKLTISVLFTAITTLLAIGLTVLVTQIAINLKGLNLPAQNYDWLYIVLRHLGYAVGYSLFFLAIITLVRNLTAGIAAIFLLPIVEALVGALLSLRDIESIGVLPLASLERFGSVASDVSSVQSVSELARMANGSVSALAAGLVVAVWLVGLWLLAWILFLRRDAA